MTIKSRENTISLQSKQEWYHHHSAILKSTRQRAHHVSLLVLSMTIDSNILGTTDIIFNVTYVWVEEFTIRLFSQMLLRCILDPHPPGLSVSALQPLFPWHRKIQDSWLFSGPMITTCRHTGLGTKLPVTFISSPFLALCVSPWSINGTDLQSDNSSFRYLFYAQIPVLIPISVGICMSRFIEQGLVSQDHYIYNGKCTLLRTRISFEARTWQLFISIYTVHWVENDRKTPTPNSL